MREKRNGEWGEGQEKERDRDILQLWFFSAIWRAQRKTGDEYGRSSSHSLTYCVFLCFSFILFLLSFSPLLELELSAFLWSSFCPFYLIYTSLFTVSLFHTTFFLEVVSLSGFYLHFCPLVFPPLFFARLLITIHPTLLFLCPSLIFLLSLAHFHPHLTPPSAPYLKPPQPSLTLVSPPLQWDTFPLSFLQLTLNPPSPSSHHSLSFSSALFLVIY